MENPFKTDDKVLTKVKGVDVEATVTQVFNKEVQVKTVEGKVLWRTMHTVWNPGDQPIAKPSKDVPSSPGEQVSITHPPASGEAVEAGAGEHAPEPVQHVAEESLPAAATGADTAAPVETSANNEGRKGRHGNGGKRRNRNR